MNKKITVSVWLTSIIIAMAVTFSITMMIAMERFDSTVASVQKKELMYSKISEIDTYVRANDYYTIDETLLYDTIASGYIFGTGDVYAKYYTAEAYTALVNKESGKTLGVGVELAKDTANGYAKVLSVYANSPAADLGIAVGDYITNIGDIDVKNLATTAQIQESLLGESGTTTAITWLNATMESTSGVATRRNYKETTVSYEMVGAHGYLRVRTFAESTASELDYAITQLTAQGAAAIILDLRNNDGGNLDYAIECIALLCDKGLIASTMNASGMISALARSETEGIALPMVCIINENTAAGAELFADSARALSDASLVGSQSAGRGMIQGEPYRFSDGSAVILTVAQLLTGHGDSFEGVGVAVDVEKVLNSEEQQMFYSFTTQTDPQIQKAVAVADSITGTATVEAVTKDDEQAELGATVKPGVADDTQAPNETDDATAGDGTGGDMMHAEDDDDAMVDDADSSNTDNRDASDNTDE